MFAPTQYQIRKYYKLPKTKRMHLVYVKVAKLGRRPFISPYKPGRHETIRSNEDSNTFYLYTKGKNKKEFNQRVRFEPVQELKRTNKAKELIRKGSLDIDDYQDVTTL